MIIQNSSTFLRFITFLSVVLIAVYKYFALENVQSNQIFGFYALLIVGFGIIISLAFLKNSFLRVLRNPDLLVPLGFFIIFDFLIGLLSITSSFFGFRNGKFDFTSFSLLVVFAFLLRFTATVFVTGWMTKVILDFYESDRVDLFAPFRSVKVWFPRTLVGVLFGSIPIFVLLYLMLPLLYGAGFSILTLLIYIFIILIGVFSLIWNLATSVLIPHILMTTITIKEAVIEGVKISWLNRKKMRLPLILLMIFSGWIVFISVTYKDYSIEKKKFGEYSYVSSYSLRNQSNFSTDFVWVGDYQTKSKWHDRMMSAVKEQSLPTIDLRITILMLFLSLVVNLEILSRYLGKNEVDMPSEGINTKTKLFLVFTILYLFIPLEVFAPRFIEDPEFAPKMAEIEHPKVFTDENIVSKQPFFDSEKIAESSVKKIFVGNFDAVAGDEKVFAYRDKAVVFEKDGTLRSEIKYDLGITQDSVSPSHATLLSVDITDFDGDGKYEFVGVGNYPYAAYIIDQKGKIVWKYQGKEIDVKNVVTVDVDNDERREIVVLDGNQIRIFDRQGNEIKTLTAFKSSSFSDNFIVTKNGKSEINFLINRFSDTSLVSLDGKTVEKIEMPTQISGVLVEKDMSARSLYFDNNEFGLFNLDGNLEARLPAPYSEIKKTSWDENLNDSYTDRQVSVMNATAQRFRIDENGETLLAVAGYLFSRDGYSKSMLYIYDRNGKIVYQELFNDSSIKLDIVNSETKPGAEDLLVSENENVWKFSPK